MKPVIEAAHVWESYVYTVKGNEGNKKFLEAALACDLEIDGRMELFSFLSFFFFFFESKLLLCNYLFNESNFVGSIIIAGRYHTAQKNLPQPLLISSPSPRQIRWTSLAGESHIT